MMQKLTKAELAARDALVETLAKRYEALEDAIAEFNELLGQAWDAVEIAQGSYNESIADANEWMQEIAGAIEEYMGERSEKWHESARGQAYQAWLEAFQETLDDVDLDEPDGLELADGDAGETLPDLPEEVDLS